MWEIKGPKKNKNYVWGERTKKETEKLSLLGVDSLQIMMVGREMITTLLPKWFAKCNPIYNLQCV